MSRPAEIAPTVARLLPGNWRHTTIESDDADKWRPAAIIKNDNTSGQKIRIQQHWQKADRLEIGGVIAGSIYKTPRITVAASRTAEAIAADIARRLIPDYLKAFERSAAEAEGRKSVHTDEALKLALLKKFLPEMSPGRNHSGRADQRCRFGNIGLNHDRTRVNVEGSFPFDLFVKFLATLPEEQEKHS
tara:strand:+ start:3792 stop:4358 length:567 start_codon:yes stop_codon:yes gene_type:complete